MVRCKRKWLTLCILFAVLAYKLVKQSRPGSGSPVYNQVKQTERSLTTSTGDAKEKPDNAAAAYASNNPSQEIPMMCANLIKGDGIIHEEIVNKTINRLTSTLVADRGFATLTKNCTRFVNERGYGRKPVTKEEEDFPLAFGILMYTSAHQVEQLLRTIYRPHNIYCIHVDRKSPAVLHRAMESISGCFDNVFISSRLEKVIYASVSQIHAEMNCQRDVLKRNKKWKYFIYLPGQEFPLKTNLEIVKILKELRGQNDINIVMEVPTERLIYRHTFVNGLIRRTSIRKTEICPLKTIKKGTVHTSLSREFVEFLHNSDIAKRFLMWLNDTKSPEEQFFNSLAYLDEAPGGPGPVKLERPFNALSRITAWYNHSTPCHGQYVRNVCVYSWRDLSWLVTQPHLFANKFNVKFDSLVLECLEEIINYRTFHPTALNISMYQQFVKDRSWKPSGGALRWQLP
ncbi:beta-1,3-galactosyl-O-glycosyl-glycoprotein beta-1,6-N-acetylglucosaminyltransferase-like [Saccoglossus kowalevskii]